MSKLGKVTVLSGLLGIVALAASSQGAVIQNKVCSHFGVANGARPTYCIGFSCRNNPAPVYCGSVYTNSVEAIETAYYACTDLAYSQCNETGNQLCMTFHRHENLGCTDWFTCKSYIYVTGCTT